MELVPYTGEDSEPARKQGPRRAGSFRKAKLDVRQPELVPFQSILDFLEPGDPTLWVLKLQEKLPLSLFGEASLYGGYEYDPRILFTLWMLALWGEAASSRRLEMLIRRDVRFIALAHGLRPDHATLCRFRRAMGPMMEGLLKHSVDMASEAGLVGFKRGHVDGHRLPGNVSQWRRRLKDAEAEDAKDHPVSPEPASESEDGKTKRSRRDPDARSIKTKKGFVTGYNAQALADEESGIVLSATVSNNSSDAAQLDGVLQQCIDVHGELPESIAADKGYDTPRNAHALELLGVESFIPAHHSSIFKVNEEGRVVCPAGHEPDRFESFKAKGVPVLRQLVTQCKGCPRWKECSKSDGQEQDPSKAPRFERSIRSPEGVPVGPWLAMHERTESEAGKAAMKKRRSTIERVFAHTKVRLGFRRFSLRGLDLVELEWRLEMVAHNLWRICNADLNAVLARLTRILALQFANLRRKPPALAAGSPQTPSCPIAA